jgi:hypothetical protein
LFFSVKTHKHILKNIFIFKTHDIGGIWWDLVGSGGGIKRFHQIPEAGGICGGII